MLVILVCQREGLPIAPLMMMFGVVQCISLYIHTACYSGVQDIPFQGSYQGNGVNPALWLVITMYLVLLVKYEG